MASRLYNRLHDVQNAMNNEVAALININYSFVVSGTLTTSLTVSTINVPKL